MYFEGRVFTSASVRSEFHSTIFYLVIVKKKLL